MEAQKEYEQVTVYDELAACRRQLIESGLLAEEDGQYFITEKGKQVVDKEFQRYKLMPARLVLLEHFVLERFGLAVE